ncbi:MAG: ArnT family glycosyltransferase [Gemmatimonadaceae bacterium]
MLGLSPWLSLLVVLVVALLARQIPERRRSRRLAARTLEVLDSGWTPVVIGVLTGLATVFVWGSLTRTAVVHDESAYLLQAELFSRFRFTAPTPPLPQFFEQLYVNLRPALFSKYPPGTSLLLAPGVKIGMPGAPIVVMNALSGALVFMLARRSAGGAVALLTWLLWGTSFPVQYFHAMYLSEVPTSLAWLAAWWGMSRWATSGRARDLAMTAVALALCGITRPLTAVALTISVGVVLLVIARRRAGVPPWLTSREIGTLAAAAFVALLFVGVWSWRSTGTPFTTPLSLYTQRYVPFDHLGFGVRPGDAPSATLPWDQRVTDGAFYQEHRIHTPGTLPATVVARARMIGRDMWYDWRGGLAVVALVGLVGAPLALWIGLGAVVVQLLLYLLYAHPARWSLYYMEGLPVLAFATALGVLRVLELGAHRMSSSRAKLTVLATMIVAIAYPAVVTLRQVRAQISADHAYYDAFVASLPAEPDTAIVFVRYAPSHNDGLSVVRNVPDVGAARIWTVYDRGAENAQLLRLAPRRKAYLFDEGAWTLKPLEEASR